MNNMYAVGPQELVAALSTHTRTAMCEVEVVRRLLHACDDRCPWARAALECAIGGNPLDVSDALSNLADVGVIRLSEEYVTLSRTAHDLMFNLKAEVLKADAPCGAIRSRRKHPAPGPILSDRNEIKGN